LWAVSWLLFNINISRIAERHEVVYNFELIKSFGSVKTAVINIGKGVWEFFDSVISNGNWWKLTLFFYLFYAIGSSITLSGSDIKGASRGFFYFLFILLLFNISTLWIGNFVVDFFIQINKYLSGFYFLIVVSMGLNILFIVILFLFNTMLSYFLNQKKMPTLKQKK